MEYSKPKVTIDLDEYHELLEVANNYNESSDTEVVKKFENALEKLVNVYIKPNGRIDMDFSLTLKTFNEYLKENGFLVSLKADYTKNRTLVTITTNNTPSQREFVRLDTSESATLG